MGGRFLAGLSAVIIAIAWVAPLPAGQGLPRTFRHDSCPKQELDRRLRVVRRSSSLGRPRRAKARQPPLAWLA